MVSLSSCTSEVVSQVLTKGWRVGCGGVWWGGQEIDFKMESDVLSYLEGKSTSSYKYGK